MGSNLMIVRVIWRFFFSIAIGLLLSIYLIPKSERFKLSVQKQLTTLFETIFDCTATCTLQSIDILSGELRATDIVVTAVDGHSWQWHAKELNLSVFPSTVFRYGKLGLSLALQGVYASTKIVDGQPAIAEHLKKVIAEALDLPVMLKKLMIKKGSMEIVGDDDSVLGGVSFTSESSISPEAFKTKMSILQGRVTVFGVPLIQDMKAQIQFDKKHADAGTILLSALMHADTPCFEKESVCTVEFDEHSGLITIATADGQNLVTIDNIITSTGSKEADIEVHVPIDLIQLFVEDIQGHPIAGTCSVSGHAVLDEKSGISFDGLFSLQDFQYDGVSYGTLSGTCSYMPDGIKIIFDVENEQYGSFKSIGTYDKNCWHLVSSNTKPLYFSAHRDWYVKEHDASVSFECDSSGIYGSYSWQLSNDKIDTTITGTGTCSLVQKRLTARGSCGDYRYDIVYDLDVPLLAQKIDVYDAQNRRVVSFDRDDKTMQLDGTIDYTIIRGMIAYFWGYDFFGEGLIRVTGKTIQEKTLFDMKMEHGNIQVPGTYNFVNACNGNLEIDTVQRRLVAKNFCVHLNKGHIESRRAVIEWDSYMRNTSLHIPLLLKHVFVNFNRDFFTELSGLLLFENSQSDTIQCKSAITIDRGKFNKNVFASHMQRDVFRAISSHVVADHSMLDLDCRVVTKKPLHINIPFLQSNLSVDIAAKGPLHNPQLSGSIDLVGGTITFAHRPLYITRCNFYFMPHRPQDPVVEFVARGNIKKYMIVVRANGSVLNPQFNFESTPPLPEDQIIPLLLSGSEESSIFLAMPSLIMRNIQALFFEQDQAPSRFEGYIKSLLMPLKHIRIVPSFIDQTGRGGFRGAIEIDVNDELHAIIQKNFSLSEDTRFEVEYLLSDDISVRGIKDERGDVGGEVEMRWKF